ncbi:hypothetical protein TNCV_4415781 [Trichonephila clavipes]|uniref:Uncharacterized protein n=1 Tax=Trichonephila clavipes TaxID=2585209 RepID=A0A8X6VFU7_TRICX|nr:hypothetical protein TNCV_4415781 [Trichonephila clavipes]
MNGRQNRLVFSLNSCEENAIWSIYSPLGVREEKERKQMSISEPMLQLFRPREEPIVPFEQETTPISRSPARQNEKRGRKLPCNEVTLHHLCGGVFLQ